MKNLVLPVVSLVLLFSAGGCSSGHYVSTRPPAVVMMRPAPPRANYTWIDGGYYWRGGRYMYRPGYWARPRCVSAYSPGGWVATPRGYYWRRGGWH